MEKYKHKETGEIVDAWQWDGSQEMLKSMMDNGAWILHYFHNKETDKIRALDLSIDNRFCRVCTGDFVTKYKGYFLVHSENDFHLRYTRVIEDEMKYQDLGPASEWWKEIAKTEKPIEPLTWQVLDRDIFTALEALHIAASYLPHMKTEVLQWKRQLDDDIQKVDLAIACLSKYRDSVSKENVE